MGPEFRYSYSSLVLLIITFIASGRRFRDSIDIVNFVWLMTAEEGNLKQEIIKFTLHWMTFIFKETYIIMTGKTCLK